MKRLVMVALVLMFAVACDDDNPNSPSDTNVRRFTAILLPQNEVPPVTSGPDAGASGTTQLTMTVTRDGANVITGATYDFIINVTGFQPNTTLTGTHIHNAPAGANSGIVVDVFLVSGTDTPLTSGQTTLTKTGTVRLTGTNTAASIAQGIWDNPGGHYFNVHTTTNGGGAIRGQLVRVD
jgi:hypothetical protein